MDARAVSVVEAVGVILAEGDPEYETDADMVLDAVCEIVGEGVVLGAAFRRNPAELSVYAVKPGCCTLI